MLTKSGIYQIRNTVNGKVYVGSSLDIPRRWRQHRRELRTGKHIAQHLLRAWNKYGEDRFDFEILEFCVSDVLLAREQYYLDAFRPEYNFSKTAGSTAGCRMSQEARDKIRFNALIPRYTFNDETLTLVEWAARIGIRHSTLYQRVTKYGWTLEKALTTERHDSQRNGRRSHKILYNGKTFTLAELAKTTGVPHDTLHQRIIGNGWPVEKALTLSTEEGRRSHVPKYTFNGHTRTLVEWSTAIGVSRFALSQRLKHLGWSLEEALTTPKGVRRSRRAA